MPIAHVKNITVADDTNSNIVRPSDWNSVHAYTLVDGVSMIGNTAGVAGAISSGTFYMAGGNNITLSQNANSITISNGNVLLSLYEPYPFQASGTGSISANTATSGPLSLFRFNVSDGVAAEYVKVIFSMSMILTTTAASTFVQNGTLQWGIYTNPIGINSTRMSLLGSNSLSYAVTHSGSSMSISQVTTTNASGVYGYGLTTSANYSISSGYTGLKLMYLALNSTLTQGDYWLGIHHRQATTSAAHGLRLSLFGISHSFTNLSPMGSYSSAYTTGTGVPTGLGGNWLVANGSYSLAGMSGLTNDITMSQITNNVGLIPYMKFETRS
jgi:hypothetical protein